jgi:CobQ-like glutamine amidotransferase family enzyme
VDVSEVVIAHLFPRRMNIYGDTGNVITLSRRLQWRSISHRVDLVPVGADYDLLNADIVVAGGGEDTSQIEVARDVVARSENLHAAVDGGVAFLVVCGTYQLFGRRFIAADGSELPGIGVFDAETVSGDGRMIGNVIVDSDFGRLVGFENHGGRTMLAAGQTALGKVVKGNGNNDTTDEEGAVTNNCFGTYLHGSVLPKNPQFADELLIRGMARRHGPVTLEPLDDGAEMAAARSAAGRP